MTYLNSTYHPDEAFGPQSGQDYTYQDRDGHWHIAHHPKHIEKPHILDTFFWIDNELHAVPSTDWAKLRWPHKAADIDATTGYCWKKYDNKDYIIEQVNYHLKEMMIEEELTDKELLTCRRFASEWEQFRSAEDYKYIVEDGMFITVKSHRRYTGLAEYIAAGIVSERYSCRYEETARDLASFWKQPDKYPSDTELGYVAEQLNPHGFFTYGEEF